MKKKIRKIHKKRIIVLLLGIIFIIFLFKMPHNYKIHYNIGSVKIDEEYNKKLKMHYIKATKDNISYEFVINNVWKRKLVTDTDYYDIDDIKCLAIRAEDTKLRPICFEKKQMKDVELINNKDILKHYKISSKDNKENKSYNNITIFNQDNSAFLLWNYKGFYYLNNNITDNLKITNEDVYNLEVIAKLDNLVMLADYNENYHFNKFIIIDLENGKKQTWKIDYDISMDSYILGSYDKSIYLIDKKNQVEYEIVPSHKKIRIVGTSKKDGVIYNNGFEKISLTKLTKKEQEFKKIEAYNYSVIDDNLYLKPYNSSSKILVTTKKNLQIVDSDEENVYYLSDAKLYGYSPNSGEKLLLENFEWNFNYENMIYVNHK